MSSVILIFPLPIKKHVDTFAGQDTQPWDFTCLKTNVGKSNAEVIAIADRLAKYLENVAASGWTCGLDRSRDYFNMITMDDFQANLYFTGRVPQLQSAEFNW